MEKPVKKMLSSSELSFFCTQIAMMLKSGMLIKDGIDWMYDDIDDSNVKNALYSIKSKLSEKVPLHEAMKSSGYFPPYIVNMTQIGNATGKLEDVMSSLSLYYDRENFLKGKLRNSIFYPAMLFVMMSFIIVLLVTKIFPVFEGMLEELGASASGSSFALSFSQGIMAGRIAMVSVIVIMAAFVAVFVLNKSQKGKKTINKTLSSFSLTKKITEKITAYRFSSAMSLLLSSGMNIDSSIDMLVDIVEDPILKEKILSCRDLMKSGDTFLDSVNKLSIFNGMHIQMLKMGHRVGEMDLVMNKLANIYEDESEQAINSTVSLVEPVLVGLLSVMIGLIMISVMLPLMNIMSSIG